MKFDKRRVESYGSIAASLCRSSCSVFILRADCLDWSPFATTGLPMWFFRLTRLQRRHTLDWRSKSDLGFSGVISWAWFGIVTVAQYSIRVVTFGWITSDSDVFMGFVLFTGVSDSSTSKLLSVHFQQLDIQDARCYTDLNMMISLYCNIFTPSVLKGCEQISVFLQINSFLLAYSLYYVTFISGTLVRRFIHNRCWLNCLHTDEHMP